MAIALHEERAVRGASAIAARPDGTRVHFEPYPTPLRDDNGTLIGAVNVLVDVTERREAETALKATADALAVSSSVKDDFLGLVSHELRTPVTTIYGNAQILRDRGSRLEAEQREAMIGDIAEDADRLLAIIENLLLFSRLQSGGTAEVEPQVLTHVVRQEVAAFARRHPDRTVELSRVTAEHLVVEADRTHLVLLMENLLSNAHKYGGPTEPIEVEVRRTDDHAEVLVLDRGLGLDGVDTDALFTPFFRTRQAQRTAGGLGLGLPVCQRIVSDLGGRIWAVPREGGGAIFGFAIPLAQEVEPID